MAELQDEVKKGTGSRTVIRRRAPKITATPIKAKEEVPAKRGEAPSRAPVERSPEAKAKSPPTAVEAPAGEPVVEKPVSPKTVEEAPPSRTPPATPRYQAKIVSRPAVTDTPKQEFGEDDLAKVLTPTLLKPAGAPAAPGTEEEDAAKRKPGKRRHEISRKLLQEERDNFGRINRLRNKKKKKPLTEVKQTEITTPKAIKRIIKMTEHVAVGDLAKRMGVKATDLIKKLLEMGTMVTVNQSIDFDTAVLVCSEFGFDVQRTAFEEETILEEAKDAPEDLKPRAPIVTVMGHVDHGKTTLLDCIRKTDVAAGEAGGITQHIGAYEVHLESGQKVTFLDTPGHAAFTAMRARGAKITDIVILVVAADDGIMPQTIEAIHHARAANVPILVAVNKVDKPGADPDRVKKALMEHELVPEEWGGTTMVVPVSAKTGTGIAGLLESLVLQSEIMELKANPEKRAKGIVIEARLEKGRGSVATLMVLEGTLRPSDALVVGPCYGRIRAMRDYRGKSVEEAGPASPVEIQGLNGVPEAGEPFTVVKDEREAKLVAEHRAQKTRESDLLKTSKVTVDQMYAKIQEGQVKQVNVIVKSDVQGSAEAVSEAVQKLSTPEVKVTVVHSGAGAITESDVNLASASGSLLVGFNVRPEPKARALAESLAVTVLNYSIIYEVIDEIRRLMEGQLAPTLKETVIGRAEVRETFRISKVGMIAGCMVTEGKVTRSARVRVLRDHAPVYEGKVLSLKRFKDDAREVVSGVECGLSIENFNDLKVGDIIEAYQVEEIAAKLQG